MSGCARPRAQPDIVLVLVDTLRADALGCYGQPLPTTPAIDALSRRSRLVEDVVAPAPWTKPSLASLLTGLTVREHGVRKGLGRVLGREPAPVDASSDSTGGPPTTDALPEGPPTLAEELSSTHRTVALQSNPHCKAALGFGRGFHEYRDRTGATAAALVAEARTLFQEPRGNPLFLFVHVIDPHSEYRPQLAAYAPAPSSVAAITPMQLFRPPADPAFVERARLAYLSECSEVDRAIGVLDAATRRRSPRIVIAADHGEELADHGAFEHGHTLFEELLRVPFIATDARPAVDPGPMSLCDAPRVILGLQRDRPAPPPIVSEGLLYGPDRVAIRWGRFKLVDRLPGPVPDALYDLDADPGERSPLSPDTEEGRTLQAELLAIRERQRAGAAPRRVIDAATEKDLRSLGYIGP